MSCGGISTAAWGTMPKFTHSRLGCHEDDRADPINLILENIDLGAIETTLTQTLNEHVGAKWEVPALLRFATAYNQWIDTDNGCAQQDRQLVAGSLTERLHVRLWRLSPDIVVAGAHKESLLTVGVNLKPQLHRPSSFEAGKDSLCDDMKKADASYLVDERAIFLDNYRIDPYCSG